MANAVKARWQAQLLASVPPEEAVIHRNSEISAHYADWYRNHRALLKWAGAAAFVSYKVGVALLPYKIRVLAGKIVEALTGPDEDARDKGTILADLDLVRRTNNLVFADIGWAHLAYVSPDGGMAAVEAGADQGDALIVEGFKEIEAGRLLLAATPADAGAATARVWRGNELLLRHEQAVTVQSQLAGMRPEFRLFFSVMTAVDFDAHRARLDPDSITAFATCLMAHRGRPGDFANFEDRWIWIEHGFLPKWRAVDATEAAVMPKVDHMIAMRSRKKK